jgi:hypothetical protein
MTSSLFWDVIQRIKGEVHPRIGHEVPDVE